MNDHDPKDAHIEPSIHSTEEVDEFLRYVEGNVEKAPGAGSPAIKPDTEVHDGGHGVPAPGVVGHIGIEPAAKGS